MALFSVPLSQESAVFVPSHCIVSWFAPGSLLLRCSFSRDRSCSEGAAKEQRRRSEPDPLGLTLAQIRDPELYRAQFDSFEAYDRTKWQYQPADFCGPSLYALGDF